MKSETVKSRTRHTTEMFIFFNYEYDLTNIPSPFIIKVLTVIKLFTLIICVICISFLLTIVSITLNWGERVDIVPRVLVDSVIRFL